MPDSPRNVIDNLSPDDEPQPARAHHWRAVKAGGRICDNCLKVQYRGEFDDTPDCTGTRP